MQTIVWHTYANAEEVALVTTQTILAEANKAINDRGAFKMVLAGGTTPEKVYRQLAECNADWAKWHIYFGDERCLPSDHKDRNSIMANKALLSHVSIPQDHIHIMPTELGPEQAAEQYRSIIAQAGTFDLVLLGMGEDGHTASLFPGHKHNDNETVHAVYNSPKPPPERISLSARVLSDARKVLFLVTGANKHEAVQQWKQGADLPVAQISCPSGVEVFIDAAAING